MLHLLWKFSDVVLVQLCQLIQVARVPKEDVSLVKDEAPQLGKVYLTRIPTLLQVVC